MKSAMGAVDHTIHGQTSGPNKYAKRKKTGQTLRTRHYAAKDAAVNKALMAERAVIIARDLL